MASAGRRYQLHWSFCTRNCVSQSLRITVVGIVIVVLAVVVVILICDNVVTIIVFDNVIIVVVVIVVNCVCVGTVIVSIGIIVVVIFIVHDFHAVITVVSRLDYSRRWRVCRLWSDSHEVTKPLTSSGAPLPLIAEIVDPTPRVVIVVIVSRCVVVSSLEMRRTTIGIVIMMVFCTEHTGNKEEKRNDKPQSYTPVTESTLRVLRHNSILYNGNGILVGNGGVLCCRHSLSL